MKPLPSGGTADRRAFLIAVGLALAGCASEGANLSAFTDPTFAPGRVRSLAIFPVLNASVAPAEGQRINQSIGPRIAAKNPSLRIVSPAEATTKINAAGLAARWATFLENFTSSGIPDSVALRQIGEAVGADAILQGAVLSLEQDDGQYGVNKGTTKITVQFSLLDARSGKLLWQAASEGRSITATTVEAAPPLGDVIALATDKLLDGMPTL